jgi:hypothetical protein
MVESATHPSTASVLEVIQQCTLTHFWLTHGQVEHRGATGAKWSA